MAINKKLIHFKKKENFDTEVANGNILDTSIVFIQDANKIYTHGTFYDGSTVDLSDIENSILTIINNKVDKVSGKGLSTNDYTTTEKNKLAGIASGAEVNVQSDWSVTDTVSDAYIKNKPSLATVATSGSYNDLSNKPSIDSALSTTSTKAVQNKVVTAGINAKYTKPTDGIPKSDLASAVLTSLGKADTALLNIPSEYITEEELLLKNYATKDDTQKIPIINHGTEDTTFELTPNILHVWGTVSSLTLTLAAATDSTVANYYMAEFVSGSTATTLSLPSTISWQNDISIETNKTYQISILNNCGVIGGF